MTKTEKHQLWQQRKEQWRNSGMSARAFCADHKLTSSNFYYWMKKLSDSEVEKKTAAFIPVKISSEPSPMISLALNSLRLQLPASQLAQVLNQLKQAGLVNA